MFTKEGFSQQAVLDMRDAGVQSLHLLATGPIYCTHSTHADGR